MKDNGKFKQPFAIIKHYNSPDVGVTEDGHTVVKEERLFMPFMGRFVMCAPYDNHFTYHDPEAFDGGTIGRYSPMCTCGSPAGVTGYNAYKQDASPSPTTEQTFAGEMVLCLRHGQTGKHADGSS